MPHSLRVKIKNLRYKGIITDKDCDRLCKALDNENVLDKIIAEIEQVAEEESKFNIKGARGLKHALKIINKYKAEMEGKDSDNTRDCNNCAHSNGGRCAGTEVCHECMWSNKFINVDFWKKVYESNHMQKVGIKKE